MRLLLVFSLIFFFSTATVYAEEDALPDVPETVVDTAGDVPADETVMDQDDNIFANASDDQIKEAQRFFKYCTENETLNKQKDCKCAATSYLRTRMSLGPDASPEQIMAENRNTCLFDEANALPTDNEADISKYSKKEIEEAEVVYAECTASQRLSSAFDCECFASKYLEKRHKEGPVLQKDIIYNQLRTECRNVVETTGREYSLCMSNPSFRDTNGIERKSFCECYARQWGKNFEGYKGVIDKKSRRYLKMMSRSHCIRPENYP